MIKVTRNVPMGREYSSGGIRSFMGTKIEGRFGGIGFAQSSTGAIDVKGVLNIELRVSREMLYEYNKEMRKARARVRQLEKILPSYRRGLRQMAKEVKSYKEETCSGRQSRT